MPEPHPPLAIRELPARDRPANRLLAVGPEALSDAELLATISGAPTLDRCQLILASCGGRGGLRCAPATELLAVAGATAQMVAQIKAACELHRRMVSADYGACVQIRAPADAAPLAMAAIGHQDQEHLIRGVLQRSPPYATPPCLLVALRPRFPACPCAAARAVRRAPAPRVLHPPPPPGGWRATLRPLAHRSGLRPPPRTPACRRRGAWRPPACPGRDPAGWRRGRCSPRYAVYAAALPAART